MERLSLLNKRIGKSKSSIKLKLQTGLQLWKTGGDMDVSGAWENINVYIKASATDSLVGYYELKQHESWFDEECSTSVSKRKQV
jgi:hypothetical protein